MSRSIIFRIRPINPSDKPWIESLLESSWGGSEVVSRGQVHRADQLPGFVAVQDGTPLRDEIELEMLL
jgi:hypothetical protein